MISRLLQNEVDKSEDTFLYVRQRCAQNFYEVWYTIFQQASTFMIPVLLVICTLHRVLAFSSLDKKAMEFDFTSTIQKLRDNQSAAGVAMTADGMPYDLMHDKEQLANVMSEVSAKGLLPFEYQLDFFNFVIFWYFFSSFLIQAFALLYYRKYRES